MTFDVGNLLGTFSHRDVVIHPTKDWDEIVTQYD